VGSSPTEGQAKTKSNEHTLRVLSAHESDRLTMHAGHTPSHSLSQLPTALSTELATVAGDSGESTPTQATTDAAQQGDHDDAEAPTVSEPPIADHEDFANGGEPGPAIERHHADETFAPVGDLKLKGPLMVRNIPAFDEKFLSLVNEKLERFANGLDGPPVALRGRGSSDDGLVERPPTVVTAGGGPDHMVPPAIAAAAAPGTSYGGDGTRDFVSSDTDKVSAGSSELAGEDEEEDIPLRMKMSMNFGAPLGEIY
jgi:hypothetical protein